MSRIVADTNVFISSFFGGNPRKIIDLWKSGEITLCLTKPIVDEYIEVLRRLGLQNEKDPDDNMFIECAVALKAGFVITGDKALKAIQEYMNIKIVSPTEFLNKYRTLKRQQSSQKK